MVDRQPPLPDHADEGTQLGTATRLLTSTFAMVGHVGRGVGRIVRSFSHVLAVVLIPLGTALARGVEMAVAIVQSLARRIAHTARWLWRPVRSIRQWLAESRRRRLIVWGVVAVATMGTLGAFAPTVPGAFVVTVVGGLAASLALYGVVWLVAWTARWCWRQVRPAVRVVVSAVGHWIRSGARSLVAILRPAWQWLGRAARRAAHAAQRVAASVGSTVARLLSTMAAGLTPVVRAVVLPVARTVGHTLAVMVDVWSRAVGQLTAWCGLRGRRAAHSVGVAVVRARMRASDPAVTEPAPTTRARLSDPSTVPFDVAVHQNEYLPRGGTEVHAIVEVAAHQAPSMNGDMPEAAEVILLDCSGSMGQPWSKLRAARYATEAAVDALRDGTWFAIVRATHQAQQVYPSGGGRAQVSATTRAAAKRALRLLWPEGGTAMGEWLLLARELLATRPGAIAHAILLTDGKNESESRAALEAALDMCAGQFQCDCRGIGTDWNVDELRAISTRLLGTVDIVPDTSVLADDFREMTEAAMAKAVVGATLRVWTPPLATLRYVKQVAPEIRDLTTTRMSVDSCTGDYPTGSWGAESRQYHLCVEVPERSVGEEMLASRVSLVVGGHVGSTALVKATWTDDEESSTRIDARVAHFTDQTRLAQAIAAGLEARQRGDTDVATERFGRAVLLAAESGNEPTLRLLARMVEIEDEASGTVRLRPDVDAADEMALDTRSTKTVPERGRVPQTLG